MTRPGRTPAPLVVARVLVVVQIVVAVVATVAGGWLAAGSAASDRRAAAAGDPNAWSGFGVAIGGGVLVVGLVAFLALGIPLLVLRGSTPTRRVTGRGLLVLAEVLLALPLLIAAFVGGADLVLPSHPGALLFDAGLLTTLVVTGCLLAPSVGRWTDATPSPHADVS